MKRPEEINVLIACEESQAVTIAFRKRGFNAFSCDIQDCSGGHPEWHYKDDILNVMNKKGFCDGVYQEPYWDIMIAFPPCTHLACSGAKHFSKKIADNKQKPAIDFFLQFTKLPYPWAIENPVGIMSTNYRIPDQIIQPWYFGDEFQKTTCLWLNGLPKLFHAAETDLFNDTVTHVGKGEFVTTPSGKRLPKWYSDNKNAKNRSKTFPGIAEAMATQWGDYLINSL